MLCLSRGPVDNLIVVGESSLVVLLEFHVGGDSCVSYKAHKSQICTCLYKQLIKQAN